MKDRNTRGHSIKARAQELIAEAGVHRGPLTWTQAATGVTGPDASQVCDAAFVAQPQIIQAS
jgi:hypothetical protein